MKAHLPTIVLGVLVVAVAATRGQPAAAPPASRPATTSVSGRHELIIPPGFARIVVGERRALAEPADEAWVKEVLQTTGPATRPSTMPSDLLAQLKSLREQLKAQMMKDLAISDAAIVDKFLDDQLAAGLKRLEDLKPSLYYMVATEDRVKELLKSGWTDPCFYYNRVADRVQMSPTLNISEQGAGDDMIIPIIHKPDETPDAKKQQFTRNLEATERMLAQAISFRGQEAAHGHFIQFIGQQVIEPLKLKPDQDWLGVGLAWTMSVKYASELNNVEVDRILQGMSKDDPRNPIRTVTIDLVHPTPADQLRPQAIRAYNDAFRRKSIGVVVGLLSKAEAREDVVPKLITAIRQSPPADGEGLLKLIQQTTGIDVSAEVRPVR